MIKSTVHISNETISILKNQYEKEKVDLVIYDKISPGEFMGLKEILYGWFIHIPEDEDLEDLRIPEDLRECCKFAKENDCVWLCLDCDGMIVSELPTYDW